MIQKTTPLSVLLLMLIILCQQLTTTIASVDEQHAIYQMKDCPGISADFPAVCCYEVLRCFSLSPSGYYWIMTSSSSNAELKFYDLENASSAMHVPGGSPENPADICADIVRCNPSSQSGDYWIKPSTFTQPFQLFCNLDAIRNNQTSGKSSTSPANSCRDIFQLDPTSTSGNYWIKTSSSPQ